jgi:hypothetical protein
MKFSHAKTMKFKISKSERKKYFGTNCMFAVFFHFIAHFLLLIAHFLGKPECIPPHLERFSAQLGVEKQVGLRWLFWKKTK